MEAFRRDLYGQGLVFRFVMLGVQLEAGPWLSKVKGLLRTHPSSGGNLEEAFGPVKQEGT